MVILFYPTSTSRRNALSKRNIQKEKIETDKRRKHFFILSFIYLVNGLTNATSQDVAWCPKYQTAKWCCWFDGHSMTRLGSQKTWIFISLHRLQIRHSKILLILARPLSIGYFTFYYFSFFLIFNRMDAWSLMRGDAFIHFVCGSRRVNIRLGVLLLIPKSPQYTEIPSDLLIQYNPNVRELSVLDNKSLISGFGLFCLGNTDSDLGQKKISLISGSLISGLHCTFQINLQAKSIN